DRVLSQFEVELAAPLPPGTYDVWGGLYESDSAGALRLPVTAPGELLAGDGQVKIGQFTVQ
ncbi:MAG: hypothetical protein WAU00_05030, partial [Caldilinea sp.]